MFVPGTRLPSLNSLKAFVATARLRSFTRAAEAMHLTQPAVSRQIRELANGLNTELFIRGKYDIQLTPEGETLYELVGPFLDQFSRIYCQNLEADKVRESFVIFTDPSLTNWLLSKFVSDIKKRWPDNEFQLISSESLVAEYQYPIDLAFQGHNWGGKSDYEVITICDDRILSVIAPSYPYRVGPEEPEFDRVETTIFELEIPNRAWGNWDTFCLHNNLPFLSSCTKVSFSNYINLINATKSGHGVGLVWERSIAQELKDGQLMSLGCCQAPWPHGVCAYLPNRSKTTKKGKIAREIVEWVADTLSND
tara:strand:- start:1458 stop:2381 length:924 start_codon:yes stop_codon:yes gene_type:complete